MTVKSYLKELIQEVMLQGEVIVPNEEQDNVLGDVDTAYTIIELAIDEVMDQLFNTDDHDEIYDLKKDHYTLMAARDIIADQLDPRTWGEGDEST